jgi:pimeloyl-ACP methyl ester carboxylesterase
MTTAEYSLSDVAGPAFGEGQAPRESPTPLWREALFPLDWLSLRASGVYWGFGVPHGEGEPVVVVPGFLATDTSLVELFWWLGRIGYRPRFSNIGRNADCPDHMASKLLETIQQVHEETGQRVRLIGHSLGGLLGRSIALGFPEYVSLVISMGSPFRDAGTAHPALVAATDALRGPAGRHVARNLKPSCFSPHCGCNFARQMTTPDDYEVAHYAIYSKKDGVVEWEKCAEEDPALNDEVGCTHLGMAFHPGVYRVLARRLRQAPGS